MSEKFQLERANTNDIPLLKNLVAAYWREIEVNFRPPELKKITLLNLESSLRFNYPNYETEFNINKTDFVYLAKLENIIVGFVSYRIDKESNELFIYDLMVKNEFYGKGFGSELIEFAINEAKNENISKIGLWVDDINTKAEGLYKKYNFVFQDYSKLQWYNEEGEVILETTSEYMTKTDIQK